MTAPVRCFDRLRRRWVDPPAVALSAQIVLQSTEDPNRSSVLAGTPDNHASVETADGSHRVRLLQASSASTLDACLELASTIDQWSDLGASWDEIVTEVSPILQATDVDHRLARSPVEAEFERRLPNIRQVFLAPFQELRFDTERVPVARARRISPRATQVLSSHTEDWLRVGASGVTPRRIEALVREEVVDLYENRVAARLIDEVKRTLRRTLDQYNDFGAHVSHEVRGWWRQESRQYELWGAHPPGEDLKALLRQRRDEVQRLIQEIGRLCSGPLYTGVPKRARVPQPIRTTNLLADDVDYRAVHSLWLEWWKRSSKSASPEEREREVQTQARSFDQFTWLLLGSAIRRLGAADTTTPGSHGLAVQSPWGRIALTGGPLAEGAAWTLSLAGKARAVIVPIAAEILGEDAALAEVGLRLLANAEHRAELPLIALFPGTGMQVGALPDHLRGLALQRPIGRPTATGLPQVWTVPVSPLDLQSIERLERVVRWFVLESSISAYPVIAHAPPGLRDLLDVPQGLKPTGERDEVAVLRRQTTTEWSNLEQRVDALARRLDAQPRQRGALEASELRAGLEELRSAAERLLPLTACPVCPGCPPNGVIAERAANTFEAKCSSCSSRWGLRHDPVADDRIPFLWIGEHGGSPPSGPELEQWLGRDVLALPCESRSAPFGTEVISPWTGTCTASTAIRSSCARCAAPTTDWQEQEPAVEQQ